MTNILNIINSKNIYYKVMAILYYWYGLDPYNPNTVKDCVFPPYHLSFKNVTRNGVVCNKYVQKVHISRNIKESDLLIIAINKKDPKSIKIFTHSRNNITKIKSKLVGSHIFQVGTTVTKFCTIVFK